MTTQLDESDIVEIIMSHFAPIYGDKQITLKFTVETEEYTRIPPMNLHLEISTREEN